MKTTMLKNEFWYGGAVYEGYRQPVSADDIVDWDFRENPTHNQIMPLFLSSKGRYIWSNAGFHISFQKVRSWRKVRNLSFWKTASMI